MNSSGDEEPQSPVYCKVCSSFVPKRDKYNPSICEACKKFFTRTSKKLESSTLVCISGYGNCPIGGNFRRFCTSCRFTKCLQVGMRGRSLQANDGDEGTVAAVTVFMNGSSDNTIEKATLIHDPVIYDGTVLETTLRVAAKAIVILHGLESTPLRNFDGPITDLVTFWQLTLKQLFTGTTIGVAYGREMSEHENLPEAEVDVLTAAFLPAMTILYYMLPNNTGASFIGINDLHMEQFFYFFPGFANANKSIRELGQLVAEWNPSFFEFATLTAFCLFRMGNVENGKIHQIRKRILILYNLYQSKTCGPSRTAECQVFFKKSFRLIQKSIRHLHEGISIMKMQMAELINGNSLFQEVLLTSPERTKLGMLFPKTPDNK